ncbi:phosphoglycerate dehydrogenase [Helcobacillus sp. ACRRO]|uniref:phosphoglycerate dehydrogenase n=1 Tax=Helcobacillus sp. ACRRO TaxID=2918202 RepID=UPI001EF403C6|nr:phosphoglycerate dehydrogenase [Helcobacillus sp. ACRRO]
MTNPVVLIAEELSPATRAALGDGVDVRTVDGTDRVALLDAVSDVDALLVRSATTVDTEVFQHAPKLKAVARAGVGLDNVDVDAATSAGVMVINAPTSNTVSAAELAIAHMLAGLRHIAEASASTKDGRWERKQLTGLELFEKTVGIVGFGRIGQLVAERLQPFGVELLCYDPYVSKARAAEFSVTSVTLEELMRRADILTIHMPKTPETTGMIGADQFAVAKPSLHVVNAARGGLIDEDALYDALTTGQIRSAGLDVFSAEPPSASESASRLLTLPNVTLTPHLGASTDEAQERAGVAVAKSVRLALAGELVPDAVNVSGGEIAKSVRPGIALADRMGQVFTALADYSPSKLKVIVRGEIAEKDVSAVKLSALRGVFRPIVDQTVSYVNAPVLAEQRDIDVELVTDTHSERFRNEIELRGTLSSGRIVSVVGTLASKTQEHKLVGINGHQLDVPLSDHMLVITYRDRPGIVGQIGAVLGGAGSNIAGMQVSREADSGSEALVALNLDRPATGELAATVQSSIDATRAAAVNVSY